METREGTPLTPFEGYCVVGFMFLGMILRSLGMM